MSSNHNTNLVRWSGCVVLCHKSPISDGIQRGTPEWRGIVVSLFIKQETIQKGTFHLCGHSRLRIANKLSYFIKWERRPFTFWDGGDVLNTKKKWVPDPETHFPHMKQNDRFMLRSWSTLSLVEHSASLPPTSPWSDWWIERYTHSSIRACYYRKQYLWDLSLSHRFPMSCP